ncbi:hypothetical protein ABES80_10190 [Bacillus gobiensis]|uniref:hypothetical protein n=1 Tax=Bacillus gobiensis TaxID=1441095 RepID=UPI003D1D8CC2
MESGIQASGFVVQPRLRFKNRRDKMIYQLMIEEANYIASDRCEVGETIVVLSKLSEELGWTREMIKGSLDRLQKDGYINLQTQHQKKGILITICEYKELQSLKHYKALKEGENPHENTHEIPHENPHEDDSSNAWESKGEGVTQNGNPYEKPQGNPHEIPHTITAFINSIININKTLKEYIVDAPVKNKNLSSIEDIKTFVDFASQTNALPQGINLKILVSYFDCIRLTRSTCMISANIVVKFIEKIYKYSANQIHYAMWKHVEQHDDKKESYTLGILRNTNEHEARRGLMKLKNKGGGNFEKLPGSSQDGSKYEYGF